MHDLFASRRGTALYLLAWLLLGSLLAALIVVATAQPWLNCLLFAVPIALLYAIGTAYSVYHLSRAFPLADKGLGRVLGVFGLASLFSGLFWAVGANLWNALSQLVDLPWVGIVLDRVVAALVFGLGTVLYVLFGIAHYLMVEFERSQEAGRRELESRLLAQEAELRLLRLQIDPHFLFNSLNSISALTSQDPGGARQMTLLLADFLRQSLRLGACERISLQQELSLARNFLAIEKTRFGARLMVEEIVDDDAMACLVPPLILQPLVENAVKHGISQLPDGGTIRITTRRQGSILRITIDNSVDADQPTTGRRGIGLANVCQRLGVAYGNEANIRSNRQADRFVVEITLPAEIVEK